MKKGKDIIVGFPLYPGCTLMDFAGATQVFSAPFGFKAIWLAAEASITTSDGVSVLPNYHFDNHPPIDILFIPGGAETGVINAMQNEPYLQFLRTTAATAQWKGSVCTGAFILAAAGLLHNCEATTYWSLTPTLALLSEKMKLKVPQDYPRFLVDRKTKTFTGGGISSSVDLALQLVIEIKGVEIAQETQLFIQYQPKPPVDSGDPSTAPAAIVQKQREAGASYAAALAAEIQKLL